MVAGGFDSHRPTRLWRMCLEHLREGDSNPHVASGSEPANVAPCQYLLVLDSGALRLHQTSKLTIRLLMTRTTEQMKAARHFRMECILLGMAMARDGDRELIIDSINEDELQSELIGRCIKAVKTKAAEDVAECRRVLAGWGVKVGASVSESLIATVNLNNAQRNLAAAVDQATIHQLGDGVSSAIEKVEICLARLKDMQKEVEENGVAS